MLITVDLCHHSLRKGSMLFFVCTSSLTTAGTPHRDLIWSSSSLSESHEETEQTETDWIQKNCGNVSKMLQEVNIYMCVCVPLMKESNLGLAQLEGE